MSRSCQTDLFIYVTRSSPITLCPNRHFDLSNTLSCLENSCSEMFQKNLRKLLVVETGPRTVRDLNL